MRIVITGASGSIGTALLQRLMEIETDHEITAIARRVPAGRPKPPYSVARWVGCDLGEPGAPEVLRGALGGADAVVHLAWALQPYRRDPPMWRTNVEGSRHLLDAAVAASVPHIVALSSVAAYAPVSDREVRVDERWPTTGVPRMAYSRQKVLLERLLDAVACNQSVTVTRLRPTAVVQRASASQVLRYTVSPLVPTRALGRSIPVLPLDPDVRFQLVHATDVADAILRAITTRLPGAVNLAAEPVIGPEVVAQTLGARWRPARVPRVRQIARVGWRTGIQPAHPGWLALLSDVPFVAPDAARERLGWAPRCDAIQTLNDLVAGMREGAGAASPPLHPRDALPARLAALLTGRVATQSQD